jgi:penicillin amidase
MQVQRKVVSMQSVSARSLIAPLLLLLFLPACRDDGEFPDFDAGHGGDPIAAVPIDETLRLEGLGSSVDVIFDDLGVPHVFASDLGTTLFMQGYLTAQSRFWEMDMFRRVAEGRLSEILGRVTLFADVEMRTAFMARDGRRLEEAVWQFVRDVDPETARLIERYAAGVNAWLADLRAGRNGATLPPEYALGLLVNETPESLDDWRPQDTLAIARLQAWSLSESLYAEIDFARVVDSLPEEIVRDVFRSAPSAPATILPGSRGVVAAAAAGPRLGLVPGLPNAGALGEVTEALAEMRRWNPFGSIAGGIGSNNWIVSPELSANGHAMLANDPHLGLFNPPVWHMIQLDAGASGGEGLRANGVIFPGLPGVILGHNDVGAWGATTAAFDVTDVYVEEITTPPDYPESPRTVLFEGEQVPVLRVEETFEIKDRPPFVHVIEIVPHHGPMVPDPEIRDDVVGLAASGMSFRWTGHELTNDARFLLDMNRARNVSEFNAALENFAVGAQNWIWADVSGDIAYSAQVLVPQRPAGSIPYLPMRGSGEDEWLTDAQGNTLWLPADKLPRATNPAAGFLASANNDHFGNSLDNDPLNDEVYLGYSWAIGFRAERIEDLLSNRAGVRPAGARMSAAEMSRYQYDHQSKEAARLVPFLLDAAEARADLLTSESEAAVERLRAWGVERPGSPAYDAVSGVDAAELRDDVPPRTVPVSDEERADGVATSIFAAWSTALSRAVFVDDFEGSGIGSPGGTEASKALLHLLEDVERTEDAFRVHTKGEGGESHLWDDKRTIAVETRDQIMLAALQTAVQFLAGRFDSSEPGDWLWGQMHQVSFQHFIGQAGLSIFDLGPFAASGARFTVNPASYSLNDRLDDDKDFIFSGGPSQRFVAVLDPTGIRAVNSLPGGNNGDPGGEGSENFGRINPEVHYGDLIPGWINGETFEYRVRRSDVAEHAARKIRYVP